MRKTTAKMLTAIRTGTPMQDRNTTVDRGERGMIVRLHGNLIALVLPDRVELNAQGWATATTCDRLHAIARELTGHSVGRKQGNIVTCNLTTGERATYGATETITLPRVG